MSVARGVFLIPIIIILNQIYGLHGVIVSLVVSELLACLVGIIMWLAMRKKILSENQEQVK